MAKAKASKKKREATRVEMAKKTQETAQIEIDKEKIDKKTQEANQFETIDQTVQRVKKDMTWVGVSIVVSAVISLIVGKLIKF